MTRPRTIVVVRHGKSSWKTNDPDIDRPLSPRGTRDAVVAGQQLAPLGVDVVLVSPATRAQQTWQCLEMGGLACDDVRTTDALRPFLEQIETHILNLARVQFDHASEPAYALVTLILICGTTTSSTIAAIAQRGSWKTCSYATRYSCAGSSACSALTP